VPTQHNRPYELAEAAAKAHRLLLVKAAEITRDTPPGHFNALFLRDIQPLATDDFVEAVKQANQQGAFVFWNHHAWKGEEQGRWMDVHTTLYDNHWLHGMEVCNGDTYYPTAHRWCLEKKLTMLGNSDIHDPDLRTSSSSQDHRTLTLVFAKERTLASLQEALQAGRTVVWCKDQLIGREELLSSLAGACLQAGTKNGTLVEVHNGCQADIRLELTEAAKPLPIVLPAHATTMVKVSPAGKKKPVELKCRLCNFLVAPEKALEIVLPVRPLE
jgi:3',5'-nucleoside bisphosphate phosphatase